jgi:hypothetical protein
MGSSGGQVPRPSDRAEERVEDDPGDFDFILILDDETRDDVSERRGDAP